MVLSVLYVALQRVLQLLCLRFRSARSKGLEIVVRRHQIAVPRRQVRRPVFRVPDRVFLSAGSRLLRRITWSAFVLTPATLLRGTGSWSPSAGPIADRPVDHRSPRIFED